MFVKDKLCVFWGFIYVILYHYCFGLWVHSFDE